MNVRKSASQVLGLRFALRRRRLQTPAGQTHQPGAPWSRPRLLQRRLRRQVPIRSYIAGTATDELPGTDVTFAFATS
jgi:hypothetical protein